MWSEAASKEGVMGGGKSWKKGTETNKQHCVLKRERKKGVQNEVARHL